MSWVDLANWAELNPKKGWVGLISAQHIFFLFFCGPGPAHTFGMGHNRPDLGPLFMQRTGGEEEEEEEEKEKGYLAHWWSGLEVGSAGGSRGVG